MRVLALAAVIVLAIAPNVALAQENNAPPAEEDNFSPQHLALAQEVIELSQSTAAFDDILPRLASTTQGVFLRSNPSIALEVEQVVLEVALELAVRRADLARTLQGVWARRFSEAELEQLKAFFGSDVGKKFIELTPTITALSVGAARQWEQELSQVMLEEARKRLVAMGAL